MTDPIPFSGGTLNRVGDWRANGARVDQALADPRARGVVLGRGGVLLDGVVRPPGGDQWSAPTSTGETGVRRVPLDGRMHAATGEPLLLGIEEDGAPLFVLEATDDEAGELIDLRGGAAVLGAADAGLIAYAGAMRHWHRAHRYCGRCGKPTTSQEGGHSRVCENKHAVHPRTDPVVIMLVVDTPNDRVLMGRQAAWPPRRFSALAGFVEPGETLESAVAREVGEEAGVRVGEVRYVASQPWPFPASLMLGFEADYAGGEADTYDAELESVRWFSRAELEAAVAAEAAGETPDDDTVLLPPKLAIARHLIEHWLRSRA